MYSKQSIFRSDMGVSLSLRSGFRLASLTTWPLLKVLCHD